MLPVHTNRIRKATRRACHSYDVGVHRTLWSTIVVVVALAVFGVAIYLIVQHTVVPHAGETLQQPGGPSAPVNTLKPSPPPLGTVAFLGDDYTAGVGASTPGNGFATQLGYRLDVNVRIFGVPGADYARPRGHPRRTYASEVPRVVASKLDVVVVSGGRNDLTDSLATFATSARQLFATLHAKLPHAVLAAVAPWWGDSPHPPELRVLDAPIRAAVLAAGGHYLNLPDPLTGHKDWMANLADPNDAGYRALAASLAPALRPLIAERTHPSR